MTEQTAGVAPAAAPASAPAASVPAMANAAPAAKPTSFVMPLDEFCAHLSRSIRSPELIAGFRHTMLAEGVNHGLAADYQKRFTAFVNAPA